MRQQNVYRPHHCLTPLLRRHYLVRGYYFHFSPADDEAPRPLYLLSDQRVDDARQDRVARVGPVPAPPPAPHHRLQVLGVFERLGSGEKLPFVKHKCYEIMYNPYSLHNFHWRLLTPSRFST